MESRKYLRRLKTMSSSTLHRQKPLAKLTFFGLFSRHLILRKSQLPRFSLEQWQRRQTRDLLETISIIHSGIEMQLHNNWMFSWHYLEGGPRAGVVFPSIFLKIVHTYSLEIKFFLFQGKFNREFIADKKYQKKKFVKLSGVIVQKWNVNKVSQKNIWIFVTFGLHDLSE